VAAGGALGSAGRYAAVLGCERLLGDRFAYGVLIVNLAGCLAIGLVIRGVLDHGFPMSESMRLAIVVGLLGGLTTFSSFGYDTLQYIDEGRWVAAAFNVGGNVLGGITACAFGAWLASLLGTQ
jgi:CrcB protein